MIRIMTNIQKTKRTERIYTDTRQEKYNQILGMTNKNYYKKEEQQTEKNLSKQEDDIIKLKNVLTKKYMKVLTKLSPKY